MISFEDARKIVLSSAYLTDEEAVPLQQAFRRILAQDVYADRDIPPFNKSAMDGYACKSSERNERLTVIETIPAGAMPRRSIGSGECAKVMTGAMIPEGADCVVIVEKAKREGDRVTFSDPEVRSNICVRGEDIKKDALVLTPGSFISAANVAVLATVGCDPVTVRKQPAVGVLATGSELVEPSAKPDGASIRNSNSHQLCAQIELCGCRPAYYGIAGDSPQEIGAKVEQALDECDVLLVSGGVSAGDYDFVPGVLKQHGVDLIFDKVAIKPGKPTVFGSSQDSFFFGMPGNPVSTFVIFEVLVKPFLLKLMGFEWTPQIVHGTLAHAVPIKKSGRLVFLPVQLMRDGTIERISYHGSAHINAYSYANALLEIHSNVSSLPAGARVKVQLISTC
ncbi:MAG: hypothetical protein GF398_20615 [Chitinivibrionales bacterium]|nr:hypothetical protein [Chitinivibrionales bacterium]